MCNDVMDCIEWICALVLLRVFLVFSDHLFLCFSHYIRLDENYPKKFENVLANLYGYGMDDKCLQL